MTPAPSRIAHRIREELPLLEREILLAQRDWDLARTSDRYQDAFLNSVALHLHSLYNGLEALFQLIAQEIDGHLPEGTSWHMDLLMQLSDPQPGRPAVLSRSTMEDLDVLRSFRHRIRNIYAANLDAKRMADMVTSLPSLWRAASTELMTFADVLDGA